MQKVEAAQRCERTQEKGEDPGEEGARVQTAGIIQNSRQIPTCGVDLKLS